MEAQFCANCGAQLGKAKPVSGVVDDISSKVRPTRGGDSEERAQKTQGTEGMSAEMAAASQLESRARQAPQRSAPAAAWAAPEAATPILEAASAQAGSTCSSCGAAVQATDVFCESCGARLGA